MGLLEDDGVGGQEEVEEAVDEGHVDAQEQHNGFRDEQPQRPAEILGDEFAEVDFNFLLFSVDAPVQRAAAELRGFLDEDDGRVGFLEEGDVEAEGKEAHYADEVLGPAPAEALVHNDEAADEGSEEGACKNGHGEDGDSEAAGFVVEHVGEDSCHDGERAGTKNASEEAGQ